MEIVDTIPPGNCIMTDFENEKGKVFERLPQKLIRKNATIRQIKFASQEWIPRERQFEGPKPNKNLLLNTYGEENVTEQIRPNIAILESHVTQNLAAGDRRNILESIHENTAQEILQKSLKNLKLCKNQSASRRQHKSNWRNHGGSPTWIITRPKTLQRTRWGHQLPRFLQNNGQIKRINTFNPGAITSILRTIPNE